MEYKVKPNSYRVLKTIFFYQFHRVQYGPPSRSNWTPGIRGPIARGGGPKIISKV